MVPFHAIPMNQIVPATAESQLFIAKLTVYGDGSPLDPRNVYLLVPPVLDDSIPID